MNDTKIVENTVVLRENDPAPFEIYNPQGSAQGILIADHASNYIPPHLNNLGLSQEDLHKHFAYDIGTDLLTRMLADKLDMRAILGTYSRLIIDLNRRYEHDTLIPAYKSGEDVPVPGNRDISRKTRNARLEAIYEPYHHKLDEMIDTFTTQGKVPLLFSMHSFTREFFQAVRPWEIGVLWARDRRISEQVYNHFNTRGYCVGDNQPYDLRMLSGSTTTRHGDGRAIPNTLIEIRNDLLDSKSRIESWAEELAVCFCSIMEDPAIYSYCTAPEFIHDIQRENTYFQELTEKAKRGEVM